MEQQVRSRSPQLISVTLSVNAFKERDSLSWWVYSISTRQVSLKIPMTTSLSLSFLFVSMSVCVCVYVCGGVWWGVEVV